VLSGKWKLGLRRTHRTKVAGTVFVEGLATDATVDGTLDVSVPELGLKLLLRFADSRSDPHTIKAETRTVLSAIARHTPVRGTLQRGGMEVGDVELQVDWALLKKALPSLT